MTKRIHDVAKAAKVSTATVSRVFSRYPHVSEKIRNKVLTTAANLGYSPKYKAAKHSYAIMFDGKAGINLAPYEAQLTQALSVEFTRRDENVQIITTRQIELLHRNAFKGIVMIGEGANDALSSLEVPIITINNPVDGIPSIRTDHAEGIKLAVNYLLDRGHTEIGAMIPQTPSWGNRERVRGCKEVMANRERSNCKIQLRRFCNSDIVECVASLVKENVTSLIVTGEGEALPLNHALYLLDKKIPDDLSIITYEDESVSKYLAPPHTTINQNLPLLAQKAVDQIIRLANGEQIDDLILSNELIERQSVSNIQ